MGENWSIGLIIIFCILLTGGGVWYLQSLQQPFVTHVQDITIDPGKGARFEMLNPKGHGVPWGMVHHDGP